MTPKEWVNAFRKNWLEKDVDAIVAMFAGNCEYWETPFKKITGLENIRKEWQAVLGMKNISVNCPVILGQNEHVFVNFELEFDGREQSIVNELKIKNGKCVYLKQWFMEKGK
jgi:hypothetical protein